MDDVIAQIFADGHEGATPGIVREAVSTGALATPPPNCLNKDWRCSTCFGKMGLCCHMPGFANYAIRWD